MSVKKTAYDTTACAGFVMNKTAQALQEAAIKGWLAPLSGGSPILAVNGTAGSDIAIPAFAHPLLVDDTHKQPQLVVDMRAFGRMDSRTGEFRVRNPIEYGLATARARLNWIWVQPGKQSLLRDVSPLGLQVFSTWIAEAITRRFGLDPAEQLRLSIYAAVLYLSNFIDNHGSDTMSEQDKVRITSLISRTLRIKAEDTLKVLDTDIVSGEVVRGGGCPVIANAIQFCSIVSGVSVRLQGLNAGVLFSILGGTWFGTNAKETAAVALEHPPTWLAILLAAVNERSFKNSGITKITERSGFRDSARSYQQAVLNLLAHAG